MSEGARAQVVESWAWRLLGASALAFAVAFVLVAGMRMGYPFELEWLEPTVLGHVQRVLDGKNLYPEPTEAFFPFLYPPLYYVIAAPLAAISETAFWPLRVVSVAATLVTFWLLFVIVKRETSSRVGGAFAVGIYASCYVLVGYWFDLARVDSLFVALMMAALYYLRFASTRRELVYAAVFVFAAGMTKQTALPILLPVALVVLIARRDVRSLGTFFGTFAVLFAATTLALNVMSDGWYGFWVFELGGQHEIDPTAYGRFFREDLKPFAVALGISAAGLIALLRSRDWSPALFWAVTTGTAAIAALTSRLHTGGAPNVLMPLYAVIAVDAGIAIGALLALRLRWRLLVFVVLALQLSQLTYDPRLAVPHHEDRVMGEEFIEWLGGFPGDVLVISHPSYAVMAGKEWHAGQGAIIDVLRAKDENAKEILRESLATAVHERRYAAIVLDIPDDTIGLPPDLHEYYEQSPVPVYGSSNRFYQVSSLRTRPSIVYVPRSVSDQ